MFGFLNIYKPKGITSHDVVSILRKVTKIRQIGHTGTLDPMAEGVLPVAISKASRLIEYLQEEKGYIAEVTFGKISDTYDVEGKIEDFSEKKVSAEEINEKLRAFSGEIEQIPPAFSAVHYKGKRLYELARSGKIPDDIPKRKVFIARAELVDFDESRQIGKISIDCSKGTYIRSIVNDLGMMLGCGALMSGLVRTKSGFFCLKDAIALDDIKIVADVEKNLINPLDVLPFNCYNLTEIEYEKVIHGQSLKSALENGYTALVFDGKLAGIGNIESGILKVKKVFGI